jgi:tetratricopeptide (TPR) repeat protein
LAEALDCLQHGDVSTAEAIFRTVAEEKAARIQRDRKDAAAYRNLGAIAGLRGPKRAFDAYARAVEFDNEDEESLLWLAWLSLERGALGHAEQNFRRVLVLAVDDGDAWYPYWARLGLGDVQVQRGDLRAARREYEIAGAIAERLAKSDPDNAGWQRDLSVSFDRVGDVLVAQGNLPEALRSFRDGLAIAERLAKSDPDNAGWRRDLAWFDRVLEEP